MDLTNVYTLNYNPRLDCWWLDCRYQPKTSDTPQYVCTPNIPVYPIRRIAAMYDGQPRVLYVRWKHEVCKAKDLVTFANADQPLANAPCDYKVNLDKWRPLV